MENRDESADNRSDRRLMWYLYLDESGDLGFDFYHHRSDENIGLQAADLFAWGIFRKYERDDRAWFDVFREKVCYDDSYL
jgi:hypothetical protein